MRRTLHMKARNAMRFYGQYSRSVISVCPHPPSNSTAELTFILFVGSRYIYDLYYDKEAISKQLYDWLLKNGYADGNLIAKWKKQGYEKLCCLRCIQTKETNFNATCICRVPQAQLKENQTIECVSCGCRGCSSAD